MKNSKWFNVLVSALAVGSSLGLPAFADDNKAELVQIIRQEENPRNAMAVDKLMTFNMSPAWWAYFLKRENKAYHLISNLAGSLQIWDVNYGGPDIDKLDTTRDAKSPLVEDAFDKLKTKAHMTIEMLEPVKAGFEQKVIDHYDLLGNPIQEKFCTHPRGGKLNITATLDTKGTALKCTVSKDGNDYHFFVPAYTDFSSSPVEECFKRGT